MPQTKQYGNTPGRCSTSPATQRAGYSGLMYRTAPYKEMNPAHEIMYGASALIPIDGQSSKIITAVSARCRTTYATPQSPNCQPAPQHSTGGHVSFCSGVMLKVINRHRSASQPKRIHRISPDRPQHCKAMLYKRKTAISPPLTKRPRPVG